LPPPPRIAQPPWSPAQINTDGRHDKMSLERQQKQNVIKSKDNNVSKHNFTLFSEDCDESISK